MEAGRVSSTKTASSQAHTAQAGAPSRFLDSLGLLEAHVGASGLLALVGGGVKHPEHTGRGTGRCRADCGADWLLPGAPEHKSAVGGGASGRKQAGGAQRWRQRDNEDRCE